MMYIVVAIATTTYVRNGIVGKWKKIWGRKGKYEAVAVGWHGMGQIA